MQNLGILRDQNNQYTIFFKSSQNNLNRTNLNQKFFQNFY